jgi:hypothetical protein
MYIKPKNLHNNTILLPQKHNLLTLDSRFYNNGSLSHNTPYLMSQDGLLTIIN